MKVLITSAAEAAIDELDDWWRANRPASRLAVAVEIKHVIGLLRETPNIGVRYDAKKYPAVRRYRLQTTPYYLYYEVDEAGEEMTIVALWSAMRKGGPPIER